MSDRALVFYDDARARTFEPFALSRPLCEMRAGALLIRERWEMALRARTAGFVGASHLDEFTEADAASATGGSIAAGTVLVNSRAAIALTDAALTVMRSEDKKGTPLKRVWYVDGALAAIELRHDFDAALLRDGQLTMEEIAERDNSQHPEYAGIPATELNDYRLTGAGVQVKGVWLTEVWDIIRHLTPMLNRDIPELGAKLPCRVVQATNGAHLQGTGPIGEHPIFIEQGAAIEQFVVLDTTSGPILIRAGSIIQAFTRVVGPCYVGRNSTLMGERISGSSIGDTCRVHGELSATVFVGFNNKGHDGFVGHSIVGRWVNMGAGTITSNLKNTYGTVALWTPSGVRDTGLQFLGTMFGDHAKTGIGLKLTTGCVLGMGANVFDRMPPKVVEPFAWGSGAPYDTYDAEKFIETAARMMSRRDVELKEAGRRAIMASHAARWRIS